ncbi:MAG TPA: OmpH family outer membrane protein [Planctomycetota bacterium]|nr:OmpH family outer membrane protein [Planctomycetota bacterium]
MAQRFASILLAAVVALGAVSGGVARAQQAAPAPKLGVIDLAVAFKNYKKSAELEERINAEREQLRGDLEALKKEIAEKLKLMDALDPDSQSYIALEDEKDALVAKYDRKKKRLEETLKKHWEEYNAKLLDDIEKVVKAYGEDNRFTLILKVDGKVSEDQRLLAGLKAVLYSAKELDITGPIVDILNRNYEMSRGGGGVTGPLITPTGGKDGKADVKPIPPAQKK